MEGYPLSEFIACLIQAAILIYLIIALLRQASSREDALAPKLIAWAFGCYFMALVFWIPHYMIMQDWPRGIVSASDLGFIGYYCLFLSAHLALAEKQNDRQKQELQRFRFAAFAAPAVVISFFVSYIQLGEPVIINTIYAAALALWSYFTLRSFLAEKKSQARLYYGLVMVVILLELFIFSASFLEDSTLYLILSYAQMAGWLFIPPALKKVAVA